LLPASIAGAFDRFGFIKAVFDALFEVILFDPGENFGGIGDDRFLTH